MGYIGAGPTRFNTADELTVTGDAEFNGNATFGDNDKTIFGAGSDLQIYHDGLHSYIKDAGTGQLRILATDLRINNTANDKSYITGTDGAEVTLYHNGSGKLATTSTGVDVTGVITTDGLTTSADITFGDNDSAVFGAGNDLTINHDGSNSFITDSGDGSLYIQATSGVFIRSADGGENLAGFTDDGAATLYHDNAAKLATTATGVDVTGTVTADGVESTCAAGDANQALLAYHPTSTSSRTIAKFQSNVGSTQSDQVVIMCDGQVGIGTSAPHDLLHIKGSSGASTDVSIQGGDDTNDIRLFFGGSTSAFNGQIIYEPDVNALEFATAGAEAMRIDNSGNVLVGKTAGSNTTKGSTLTQTGEIVSTITTAGGGSQNIFLNRQDAYGTCIRMRYANSDVGHIGLFTGNLVYLGAGNTGLKFGADIISPSRADNGNDRDNVMDLGKSASRFDNIYATNATIQTSDANEKQQIAALTDAEMTAAKAISQLFKTFKWNSAVTEKGDAARTHTGVIAQDVEAAMTAAGLDAGDYAFFISSTWWETQTEVPAVEAVEAVYEDVVIAAVLDEDGNEVEAERTEQRTVTEAVEAVDAYTRIDTYDTAEKAPEGATERTRMGIRYPELLAFVGAATEQRLANIETRLTALETA